MILRKNISSLVVRSYIIYTNIIYKGQTDGSAAKRTGFNDREKQQQALEDAKGSRLTAAFLGEVY